jgi:hypothetical protein
VIDEVSLEYRRGSKTHQKNGYNVFSLPVLKEATSSTFAVQMSVAVSLTLLNRKAFVGAVTSRDSSKAPLVKN